MSIQLEFALKYAARGLHVFPVHLPLWPDPDDPNGYLCTCEEWRHSEECRKGYPHRYLAPGEHCAQPGKCPRVSWAKQTTVDPDQIRKWWRNGWADSNIGIACGPSGIVTLDADLYKKEYGGTLSEQDMDTVMQVTGGGGIHLLYDRQNRPWTNARTGLPKGIDIRGVGGYIVVAPSIHRSHKQYTWAPGYSPFKHKFSPAPYWLARILDMHGALTQVPQDMGKLLESQQRVERILRRGNWTHHGWRNYESGYKALFVKCPFNQFLPESDRHREDASAFIIIRGDGTVAAGCHHARCQTGVMEAFNMKGWTFLQQVAGESYV